MLVVDKLAAYVSVGTARVSHAHMVLRGHRSIVNQVRYNKASALIISSGVEKIIKAQLLSLLNFFGFVVLPFAV